MLTVGQHFLLFITSVSLSIHPCWQQNGYDAKNPIVQIGRTSFKGLRTQTGDQHVYKFLGIRYAQAPKGPLRFKPPVLEDLPLYVDATRYGARCAQFPLQNTGMSEDCLFLNVHAPGEPCSRHSLPVLVWIHGGGFIAGSGDVFEGDVLAAEGQIVVVTLNYRLGVLGFLSTGDNSSAGNYGLLDQQTALKWVHKYIGHFGGDVGRITLAGMSAGAASASIHSLSPLSRGLFRHVIQMSGSASSPWATMSSTDALQAARALGSRLDCPTKPDNIITTQGLVDCIRSQRLERLVRASTVLFPRTVALSLVDVTWGPVRDGTLVRDPEMATPFTGSLLAGLVDNEGDALISWNVPHVSRYILDIHDLVQRRSFYRHQLLPTLLKQTYPQYVPHAYPTRHHSQRTPYRHYPYSRVLDILECSYRQREGVSVSGRMGVEEMMEIFGDQAFVVGTIMFLQQFCRRQPSYLYFMSHQTERPGVRGIRHSDDLAYLFGFNSTIAAILGFDGHVTDLDLRLARDFRHLITNFIKTGDPNNPARPPNWPPWPAYTIKGADYLLLSTSPRVLSRLKARKMALWTQEVPRVLASPGNLSAAWRCVTSSTSGLVKDCSAVSVWLRSCALIFQIVLILLTSC